MARRTTTRTKRVNRPKLYDDGLNRGIIREIGEVEIPGKSGSIKEQADELRVGYRAIIDVDGVTDEPIEIWHWLGLNLNDEPIKTTGRGKMIKNIYNLYTTFCLRTGLITEDELGTASEERLEQLDNDLDDMAGARLQFRVKRVEKEGYLKYELELDDLEVIDE